ncbi:hypothetical protein NDU88_000101 [Pleurodeles waltl]|uniref:Uncharacterized protein n=1 Tax=Pleurodeles waltl TaxID=8319 RepID=A0AAV7TEW2_PLEWA|nr:hypothetical protein NDU88_000101 [Pleurodeles waltl]
MSAPCPALLSDLTFRPPQITQMPSRLLLVPFPVVASRRVSSGPRHRDLQHPLSLLSPLRSFLPLRAVLVRPSQAQSVFSPVPFRGAVFRFLAVLAGSMGTGR